MTLLHIHVRQLYLTLAHGCGIIKKLSRRLLYWLFKSAAAPGASGTVAAWSLSSLGSIFDFEPTPTFNRRRNQDGNYFVFSYVELAGRRRVIGGDVDDEATVILQLVGCVIVVFTVLREAPFRTYGVLGRSTTKVKLSGLGSIIVFPIDPPNGTFHACKVRGTRPIQYGD